MEYLRDHVIPKDTNDPRQVTLPAALITVLSEGGVEILSEDLKKALQSLRRSSDWTSKASSEELQQDFPESVHRHDASRGQQGKLSPAHRGAQERGRRGPETLVTLGGRVRDAETRGGR